MPRQALLHELLHEGIWIELLDVVHAWATPEPLEEHHRTDRGGYTRSVAHALSAGLLIGGLVAAVVPHVVGLLLAILDTADTAADRRLTRVVLTELTGVRQDCLEELDGDDLDAVVEDGVDTRGYRYSA